MESGMYLITSASKVDNNFENLVVNYTKVGYYDELRIGSESGENLVVDTIALKKCE